MGLVTNKLFEQKSIKFCSINLRKKFSYLDHFVIIYSVVKRQNIPNHGRGPVLLQVFRELVDLHEQVDDNPKSDQNGECNGITDQEILRNISVQYLHDVVCLMSPEFHKIEG